MNQSSKSRRTLRDSTPENDFSVHLRLSLRSSKRLSSLIVILTSILILPKRSFSLSSIVTTLLHRMKRWKRNSRKNQTFLTTINWGKNETQCLHILTKKQRFLLHFLLWGSEYIQTSTWTTNSNLKECKATTFISTIIIVAIPLRLTNKYQLYPTITSLFKIKTI